MDLMTLVVHRGVRPPGGRDPRRLPRLEARARVRAHGDHRLGGDLVRGVGHDPAAGHGRRAHGSGALHLARGRGLSPAGGFPHRRAHRHDDVRGDLRVAHGARLHHRLHGRRPGLPALLRLHLALHLLDDDAGDGEQLPAAVLRLGGGGPGVVPADRLLVHAPDGDLRQPQGLPREPRGRLRLPAGHRARVRHLRHTRLRPRVRRGAPVRPRRGRGDSRPGLVAHQR